MNRWLALAYKHREQILSHGTVLAIGIVLGVIIPWSAVEYQAVHQADAPRPVMTETAANESLTNDSMTEWLAPKARDFCETNKDKWMTEVSRPERLVFRVAWPWGMRKIEPGTHHLVMWTNDKLATLTLGQVAKYIEQHVRAQGGNPEEVPMLREAKAMKLNEPRGL